MPSASCWIFRRKARPTPPPSTPPIDAYIEASRGAPSRVALISSLPETLSARVRKHCLEGGVVPLQGQREALEAIAAAAARRHRVALGTRRRAAIPPRAGPGAGTAADAYSLTEAEGKAALARFGVATPRSRVVARDRGSSLRRDVGFPGGHQGGRARISSTRPRWAGSRSICVPPRGGRGRAAP